ncbi:MAG: hypothetical protein ABIQ66_07490 [Novosphingobium sp.]
MNTAFSRLLSRVLAAANLTLAAGVIALAPALPTQAMAAGGFSAKLASELPAPKQAIINGVLWKCAGDQCVAPDQGSRPVLVCRSVAKAFGPVTRFATTAGEISADELAKCAGK